MTKRTQALTGGLAALALISNGIRAGAQDVMEQYNVVWDSPSEDHNGSMPIGNGDLAANVWVEPNGDLVFYISKSDAWSAGQDLLKLGRVRIKMDPPLVAKGTFFKQKLDLASGSIRISTSSGPRNLTPDTRYLTFWIDAHHPVVNVEIRGNTAFGAQVMLEPWRLPGAALYGSAVPDTVLPLEGDTIRWFQRNGGSVYADTLKNQHLEHLVGKYPDPLKNRTFGGLISGDGLVGRDEKMLVTKDPVTRLHVRVHALTAQTETPEEWGQQLAKQRAAVERLSLAETRTQHEAYWANFWNKSWIFVSPGKDSSNQTVARLIPANAHNFRVGEDLHGGNRFEGGIGRVTLLRRALSAVEIKHLAVCGPTGAGVDDVDVLYGGNPDLYTELGQSADWTASREFSVETWIKPVANDPGTRILDKGTPGRDDGFVLDTHPGNSLRLIAGQNLYGVPSCLKPGEWNHVAVVFNADADGIEMYLNGARIAGRAPVEKSNEEYAVTRAYVLQRWIQACAGRGAYPIKFNGSLFTVDHAHRQHDGTLKELGPDARNWGGCYWFQNTRLPYWAMLYSGDYDQMAPLWKMYRDALPLLKDRTQSYFNHDGVFFSETMHPWGLNPNHDFGFGNEGPYPVNPYIRYYWDGGLELSMMMLDYYDHTMDKTFVANTLLPIADEVLKFYDQHYPRNAQGKVHFSPSMSLETWHTAEDPLPIVVGLKMILPRLLALDAAQTTPEQRERWSRFLAELPETPVGAEDGKRWIKPARVFSDNRNSENPELYAVFPYRGYTVGKPDLEIAIEAWKRRMVKRTGGWTQDPIQAAMLGLTQEAKDYVVINATDKAPAGKPVVDPRFPAFWGPNFDWTPDQCHGSVTLIALQRMLMQCEVDSIRLLPAWPDGWNASFKLHAPQNTTVEGRVENGKVVALKVTPESRRKDVVMGHQVGP